MRLQPAALWFQAANKAKGSRANSEAFSPEQKTVLNCLYKECMAMYAGATAATCPTEVLRTMVQALCQGTTTAVTNERLDFLNAGIDIGNRSLAWDVPLAPLLLKIRRERNFVRPDNFHLRINAKSLVDAFTKDLENPIPESESAQLGQVLLSATMFGGLLENRWLEPFLEAIHQRHIYQEGTLLWVDMVYEHPTQGRNANSDSFHKIPPQQRRWVADCLTQLLIYRFLDNGEGAGRRPPTPWKAVSTYLKTLSLTQEQQPASLAELRRWATARSLLILPHYLLAYANGTLPATSLPVGPWLRALTGLTVPIRKPKPPEQFHGPRRNAKIVENQMARTHKQGVLFGQLLKELNPKLRKKVMSPRAARRKLNQFVANNREDLGPLVQLLVYWGQQLLSEKWSSIERRKARPLATSSVYRYFVEAGGALISAGGKTNPLKLQPQELEALFENAAAREKYRPYAVFRLAQFHGFLKAFYKPDLPEMDWAGLSTGEGGAAEPNANLISPQVYDTILASLGWGSPSLDRWQRLHVLVVILSYRFGLRPSELRSLRLTDLQGVLGRFEILVRNNPLNTIKTDSGLRRIPLNLFLHDAELAFVLDYLDRRHKEKDLFGGNLLFAHPTVKAGLLPEESLFEPVRKIIRQITRDETLVLYHLRHSFLSWLEVALHLRDERGDDGLTALDHGDFSPARRSDLIKSLMENEPHGRKSQYLLAMLAGHASPKTTHHHYLHLNDWLLGHHLRSPANAPKVNHKILAALTGLKRARTFALLQASEHPLLQTVESRAVKYAASLRHPLLLDARPLQAVRTKRPQQKLPSWEEALETCSSALPTKDPVWKGPFSIPRTEKEWELATTIYAAVRAMDGRRQKTAAKVVDYAINHYSDRWGGITYVKFDEARMVGNFLKETIPHGQILLVHHPRRNQGEKAARAYAMKWAAELGIPHRQIIQGEQASAKVGAKGCITLKVLSEDFDPGKSRAQRLSPGFCFVVAILVGIFKEQSVASQH